MIPQGLDKFGKGIAHGLASCGFGDQLLTAFERRGQQDMRPFLARWRAAINMELRTNSRGFLQHRHPSLSLPPTFPDMKILSNYACPATSAQAGRGGGGAMRDNGDMSLPRIAGFCEAKFIEWGYKSAIIKRFRDLLWEAAVIRVLRRAALEADEKEKNRRIAAGRNDWSIRGVLRPSRAEAVGTPASLVKKHLSKPEEDRFAAAFVNQGPSQPRRAETHVADTYPLIFRIVGSRQHVSTDGILEYRVEVGPTQLVALTESGIKGIRPEPSSNSLHAGDEFDSLTEGALPKPPNGPKKPPPDPKSALRMWIPACMMQQVHPALVDEFEAAEQAKKAKKAGGKGKAKAKALAPEDDESGDETSSPAKPTPKPKRSKVRKDISSPSTTVQEDGSTVIPSPALDPWFLASDDSIATPSSSTPRGFLFSFPNPDDTNVLESDDHSVMCEDGDQDDMDEDNDPPTRFDILFDQIMGASGSSSRRKKKTGSHRKRPRASMPSLPKASAMDSSTTATKRRKTTHGGTPSLPYEALEKVTHTQPRASRGATQPLPPGARDPNFVEIFSDSETAHASSVHKPVPGISRRNENSLALAPRKARRVYPGPSSSQDSGLFLDDVEVIIDLT